MRGAIATVLKGGIWTPPDVDIARSADAETAAVMARFATLTPQQVRVLMMLSEGCSTNRSPTSSACRRRP